MWKGEWKFHAFVWPGGVLLLGALSALAAVWLAQLGGPNVRQLSGPVSAWPIELYPSPPVEVTRHMTEVCLLLPGDFQLRHFDQGQPPVISSAGKPAHARAEVCLDSGRCVVRESWALRLRPEGRFYCPSGAEDLEIGRRIVGVRITGSPSMRAEGIWLFSYDRK